MNCNDSRTLIPSYLDGELSEHQAAPLRQHLMDCQPCRKAASGQKALGRWFEHEPTSDVAVPAGFAERVTRLAFAGAVPRSSEEPLEAATRAEASLQSTVLWMTAAAAAVLLVVSGMLAQLPRGDGSNLRAGEDQTLEETLEEIDALADPAGAGSEGGLQDMSEPRAKGAPKDLSSEELPEGR